jgi:hypothetical protein
MQEASKARSLQSAFGLQSAVLQAFVGVHFLVGLDSGASSEHQPAARYRFVEMRELP